MTNIQEQLKKNTRYIWRNGTMIQNANLTADDFGEELYEGCELQLNVLQIIHGK